MANVNNSLPKANKGKKGKRNWKKISMDDSASSKPPVSGIQLNKYSSTGLSFHEIDRQKFDAMQSIRAMELDIEEMLQSAMEQIDLLKSLKFFLFSSSYFAQTLTGDIYPAEIAMAKFSLANGIEDTLHSLINPGPLPLGTSHEALRHSDTTHKRKLPPNIDGETDYFVILDMVLKFLGVDGSKKKRVPIIFVEPGVIQEDYKASKLTLEKLLIETGENVNFRLYPLENLLFKLQKKCISLQILSPKVQPFSSIEMAKEMMARNKFIYSDIGCDFHTHSDANCHCCLAKVKSWVFMIALYCLNNSDVKIPGQHFPKNSSTLSEKPMLVADLDWEDDMNSNFSKISIHKEITFSQHSCISLPCSDISAKSSSITMCNDEELHVGSDEPLHPINSKVSLSARVLSKRGGKRT